MQILLTTFGVLALSFAGCNSADTGVEGTVDEEAAESSEVEAVEQTAVDESAVVEDSNTEAVEEEAK